MEILTNLQKIILKSFKDSPDNSSFYLTGGTALSAFFLEHRKSFDLDFFTDVEELITPFSQNLSKVLQKIGLEVKISRSFHSFVELFITTVDESTIIHLAVDSPFRFEPPYETKEFPCLKLDSLVDIASNKLLALFGRAALRDFIDIYFIVKKYFNKSELIKKAKQKDPGFDLYWLAVAFERINEFSDDSVDMHLLTQSCAMKELREFFDNWRKEITREITKI